MDQKQTLGETIAHPSSMEDEVLNRMAQETILLVAKEVLVNLEEYFAVLGAFEGDTGIRMSDRFEDMGLWKRRDGYKALLILHRALKKIALDPRVKELLP